MNDLQIFNNPEFGEIRTADIEGRTYFVGADVARALGYAKPQNAIAQHCRGALKQGIGVQTGNKADGTPAVQTIEMLVIPESDIYRLIVNSKLPAAEKFEKWVFDEVLPSIRKHGAYMTPEKIEEALLNPDTIIQLATALKAEREQIRLLSSENDKQRQIIGELQPKADYVDYILSSMGTMTAAQIAADYSMTANKLNKILKEEKIQRSVGDQWVLYAEHMGMGYTKSETIPITRSDGRPDTKLFTKWTQKGRLMINEVLNKRGIYANMDIVKTA